jgi:hypothetical protein
VDAVIGWPRDEKRFIPKNDTAETKRLLGYARLSQRFYKLADT